MPWRLLVAVLLLSQLTACPFLTILSAAGSALYVAKALPLALVPKVIAPSIPEPKVLKAAPYMALLSPRRISWSVVGTLVASVT